MSVRASRPPSLRLWLHALLCLVLLGNGLGAAMASGRVAVIETDAAVAAAIARDAAIADTAGDCHGSGEAAAAHAAMPDMADDHARHGDDCLQFCLDSCLQHTHAVAGPAAAVIDTGLRDAPVDANARGLPATPRLPLLRPPIG
ncbi:CopL family metal-binding regulatory protein [Luteimonas sp. BDR2-5]|uniref:CopL family metal-binding regulatory protein n=1 Tax=Proluteimonas luteida TaxID=2878685 RepID=UPI001E550B8A|nr:CopL family metal-binding regulatory protein [Luteimonas sp. BDR2-5]MCD9029178.1 CopL family metal-binding regulatory protein [Luteimonas sp. BDR2-5]